MRLLGDDQRAILDECERDARDFEEAQPMIDWESDSPMRMIRFMLDHGPVLLPPRAFARIECEPPQRPGRNRPVFAGAMTAEQRQQVAEWFFGQYELHGDDGDWEMAIEYQTWGDE